MQRYSAHTTLYVSSYYPVCVLTLLYMSRCRSGWMQRYSAPPSGLNSAPIRLLCIQALMRCPHTPLYVSSYSSICLLILIYMCPHTTLHVSSYYSIQVLILLYVCPHTAIYVSSYCYICVLVQYVASYCYMLVLILRYMCHHTPIFVSSYCYICVLILLTSR
jgi:hypothetical protein